MSLQTYSNFTITFLQPKPVTPEQHKTIGMMLGHQAVYMWRNNLTFDDRKGYAKRITNPERQSHLILDPALIQRDSALLNQRGRLGAIRSREG